MSLNISSKAPSSSDDTRMFPEEPIDPTKNLSLFIKTVFKNSLESNMRQPEKELLLGNLRIIKSALEMTNTGIENTEEIIQQVKEIITCLESNKSYVKNLWEKKEIQLDQGRLVFSDSLKSILDDTSFEALMQSTPEEYLENITDCCLDGLSLGSKSLETLLKYCPNITKEALEQIATNWKEGSDIVTLWPLFQQIPSQERLSIVTHSLKCLYSPQENIFININDKIKNTIIQNILAIPSEERENVIGLVVKCLHRDITGQEIAYLILNISQDSHEDQKRTVELASTCFHDGISEDEKSLILGAIAKLQPKSRENIVLLALKCFHKGMTKYDKASIIETINGLYPEDGNREIIVALSIKCFDNATKGHDKIKIIQTIAQTPPEDRESIIEFSLKCFHACISSHLKMRIIQEISKASFKDREHITALASKCFHEGILDDERAELFENIVLIPPEEREYVIALSLKCFDDDMRGYNKIKIIQTIAQALPEDRESIIESSFKCFHDGITGPEKLHMLTIIAGIPYQNRESAVVLSLKCFNDRMTEYDKGRIIQNIAGIPAEVRENIVEWSIKCFNEEISTEIIEFITNIQDREKILELALSCFCEHIPRYEKRTIIQTIIEIAPEDRESAVALALQYFNGSITGITIKNIALINAQDREAVISLSSQCFRVGATDYEKAGILYFITKVSPEDRGNVVKFALEYSPENISANIIEAIAAIDPQDRENVITFALEYFPKNISGNIIETIAAIDPQDRENVLKFALEYFPDAISVNIVQAISTINVQDRENVITFALEYFPDDISTDIIQAISTINAQDRENVLKFASQCCHAGIRAYEKSGIITAITKIPPEDRQDVVTITLNRFPDTISRDIIEAISTINAQEREDVLRFAFNYFQDNVEEHEKGGIITTITQIPLEDREDVIEWALKLRSSPIIFRRQDRKVILKNTSIIPKEERSFINDPFMQDFLKSNIIDPTALLCVYLLPVTLRSKEVLLDLHSFFLNRKYDQELIASLEQKLSNETLPKATLIGLAQHAEDRYNEVLLEEHPLMQRVIELLAINNVEGIKNPFVLFKHLKELRNTPIEFKVPVDEAIPLRISMTRLQDMAKATAIKREDLPEKATKEAWELLKNDFKNKIMTNFKKAEQAFGQLVTTWAEMEGSLFKDPQNYLSALFDLTGPVSESEAKFKAILNNILSKNTTLQKDQFFTEQEEVFIKTIMVIQHCKGGKQEGIAEAYKLLDAAYKYKLQLSPPMSVEERSDLERKEEATQFLRTFIENHPITEQELIAHFKTDTLTNAGLFTALFGAGFSEKYLIEVEEDNDFVYHLNEAGAHEALSYIRDVEKKNLIDYIAGIIRPVMERIISNDTFIEKLIGEKSDQGVHDSIYLKNVIGHLIGITNELIFDRYTTNLSTILLEKSREDILKLLFTEVTPEVLISELVRVGLPAIYMKLFLAEEQVTKEIAKKILELTGYLES